MSKLGKKIIASLTEAVGMMKRGEDFDQTLCRRRPDGSVEQIRFRGPVGKMKPSHARKTPWK